MHTPTTPPRPDPPSSGFSAALLKVLLVALLIVLVDQGSKAWIAANLRQLSSFDLAHDRIVIIPGFFELVHHRNYGAAFGILQGRRNFFIAATLLALGLLYWMFRCVWLGGERRLWRLAVWPLFIGGAVGNLIDRLRGDGVVDFLHFYYEPLGHYPSFNVADSCITIGISLLILQSLPRRKPPGVSPDAPLSL